MNLPRCYNCKRRPMGDMKPWMGNLRMTCPICDAVLIWPNLDTTKPDLVKDPSKPFTIRDGKDGLLRWHNGRQLWLPIPKRTQS